ncbi:MAG TPA: alpha/beta hydrolase [Nitrospiraceae bacterium]|nr:MAG: alpha/beta hydrolase [Nitrospirae bacterium GWA2_46_11]OGW23610.1 MAG: alpha/beta hydrolase [Nitrospirae bacterium GWB2_47_37]HAK89986.1 alpha/beta hydrolase [Nitrospiraceae bacterium]HCL81278.1 alpha/beta hydrolase [Nitrospiraceae bacterium]
MNKWIDRKEYPFKSHFLELEMGKMHYVDEGSGEPIVMVHGNPAWSFLYRHLIKCLSKNYRCIAVDLIGFGLSDKPWNWSYYPEDHAKNLKLLIEKLDLKGITLVVQDWGGPIGLSYAVNSPENMKRIIIMNTWMWSVKGDPYYERFSKFVGGPIGRFLIKRFNFFVRVIMKKAMGDTSKLPTSIHQHYFKALEIPEQRKGCWTFPKRIIDSSDWLDFLWSQSDKIKDKPALILWGMKDIAFREQELSRWISLFSDSKTIKYDDVGHFVQEEKGSELCPVIEEFLRMK